MSDFVDNYLAVLAGLGDGLGWLWLFLIALVVAILLINGGIGVLILIDQAREKWHESRGHVRVVGANGREQWVPIHPESRAALERTFTEIRDLPEVRRG